MARRATTELLLCKLLPRIAAFMFLAPPCFAGSVAIEALQRNGKPLTGAVVMLEVVSPTLPPAAPLKAVMDQVDLAFAPDVLVLPVHSSVQFPNSDAVSHQVYSFSSARSFQLPLYRGKPYPPVSFEKPGIVTLGCNIHDNMIAYIVITEAPWFGRTDGRGSWIADDVSAGRYRLRIWHPLMNETGDEGRIVEVGEQRVSATIKLTRSLKPSPLSDRPHSWDY
jgi:plastocyanin